MVSRKRSPAESGWLFQVKTPGLASVTVTADDGHNAANNAA